MQKVASPGDAYRTVEQVVRTAYGRLLAYLSSRSGDVTGAEDALGEALYKALVQWTEQGIPEHPEAWLLKVARNHCIDEARRQKVRTAAFTTLIRLTEQAEEAMERDIFPDDRLKVLFVCAHPAIDSMMHTPLMLQTVLGFDAARIASAFLVAPSTMGQRLVRAKTKIRAAGIAFEVPEQPELPLRLEAVLEAIYAVYGHGWGDIAATDRGRQAFADEAFWLARLVVRLLPEEPEAKGLLALLLFCEARRDARLSAEGFFVPLSEQEQSRWSRPLFTEAEGLLQEAVAQRRVGRFQLEAAIQSAHMTNRIAGNRTAESIFHLYEGLMRVAPTLGAAIGQVAALAEWQGAAAGLAALATFEPEQVASYQPFWAVKAHLLQKLERREEASRAYDVAIGLTEDAALRRFLLARRFPQGELIQE